MQRQRSAFGAFHMGVLALSLWGCAEQQPAINRVEAYALPKRLFTGEWFNQQTVTDVPGTQTVTFQGEMGFGGTHRIRWDIQEKYLYARMSYERVKGAKNTSQDTGEYLGEIVGAWQIASHFDIKRSYNPTTGEELNVLEENSADCKWYDCKYMRVDWSKNYAIDFYFLDWDENIKKEPVPFYVEDDTDPLFKPIFDENAGYIDFTSAMAIAPGSVYLPEWGSSFPLCWFFSAQDASCNTEVIKVRNSFWRREPNRDYEPRPNKGERDNWFGYFNTERWTWYPEQGLTYPTKQQFLQRHDLWVADHDATQPCKEDKACTNAGSHCDLELPFHKYDVATDSDVDGLPDAYEEEVGLNAKVADSDGDGVPDSLDDADGDGKRELEAFWAWDRANLEYRCTIPVAQREPRPVVYFNTGSFPRSLVCDEHENDPTKDNDPLPCKPYEWTDDRKVREEHWSALHHAHQNYDDAFWRVYLRGAFGWTLAELQKWLTTHDPAQLGSKQVDLAKFGDKDRGYYAFALCPNNPVEQSDPWPCRFPRHSFAQARELMDRGLTFNHLSYEQAKRLLDAGKQLDQSPPHIRVGDIRYSYINYSKDYSAVSPLGYGPSSADPRTGEIVSGYANVYAYVDYYATYMQEIVNLLNGSIKPTDYIDGLDLTQWLQKLKLGSKTQSQLGAGPAALKAMYQAMEQPWMKRIPRLGSGQQLDHLTDGLGRPLGSSQKKTALLGMLANSGVFDPSASPIDLKALAGTPLEQRMLDNEVLMASGVTTGTLSASPQTATQNLSKEALEKASLARGGFLELLDARDRWRMDLANRKRIEFSDMLEEGATNLAYRLRDVPADKVWALARKLIMRPVLEHEMGHTVGLMHNFGGSDDALNFFPEYWRVRTNDWKQTEACHPDAPKADELCPFFVPGKSKNDFQLGQSDDNTEKGLKGLEDYSYSSIMDYDHWPTQMGNGLGRYDHAALMFGYADKVEVFDDPGRVPTGLDGWSVNVFDEWWNSSGSVLVPYGTGPASFHYTNWFTQMKKDVPEQNGAITEANRLLVDYRDVVPYCYDLDNPTSPERPCAEFAETANKATLGWYANVKSGSNPGLKVRVPYIYCSHSLVNIGENCMTWDWGADPYERMSMHIAEWDIWYVLNSFTRGRYYRSPERYVERRYTRFYKRLKNFNNLFALYQGLFHQWYGDDQIKEFFADPINGWGAYTLAMNDAFNTALRTLAMPDIKGFKDKAAEPDGQMCYAEAIWSIENLFDTNLDNARYFTTSWFDTNYNSSCGYEWWECLHHIGFYLDKLMAIYTLSDPETYFVARDTAEDIREWRISFFDNFRQQLIDFFGGLLSEDYSAIAPWYDPSKPRDKTVVDDKGIQWTNGIAWRNYATADPDVSKLAPQGGPVEPATRFTLQLYAAVLGMLRFQSNFDNSFVERGRLWKKGTGNTWSIQPSTEVEGTTEFDDPFTGTTYAGVRYTDGKGIAQRMIAHANQLKARTKYCAPPESCVALAEEEQQRAEAALFEYRQVMDVMVQVTTLYDNAGQSWSDNPFNP